MADENVPTPAPTRSNDQILPFAACQSKRETMSWIFKRGKTFGHDRPRYPVLKMLWGIITNTNVDYAELMWEEFVQAMQTFLTDKASLGSPTKKGRKDKPHTRNASYYNAYLEMVAKHDQKVAVEKEGKKKSASSKQLKPKPAIEKSSKPAPAPKPKVTKEKSSKASTAKPPKPKHAKEKLTKATLLQKAGKGKVVKVRNVKSTFQLVDEPDEEPAHSEPVPKNEQESAEAIRPLPVVEGKGKANVTEEQVAQSLLALHTPKRRSTTDQFIFQRRTPATKEATTGPSAQSQVDTSTNIICDSPSPTDAETGVGSDKTSSGDQAGSDPGETQSLKLHQYSLKFPTDEHVLLEDPLSSTRILSLMKNLEDAYAIGD
ncbi:hypothetical protein Tco_0754783 [Tanacetum coccineum]